MLNSVLLVDDEEYDNYLHKRSIRKIKKDLQIFECSNGEEALQFFLNYEENAKKYDYKYPPALVFLDINMPKMDGFEFLERLENEVIGESLKSIFIIMLTSSHREDEKKKALSSRLVKDHVVKPLTGNIFSDLIEKHKLT